MIGNRFLMRVTLSSNKRSVHYSFFPDISLETAIAFMIKKDSSLDSKDFNVKCETVWYTEALGEALNAQKKMKYAKL